MLPTAKVTAACMSKGCDVVDIVEVDQWDWEAYRTGNRNVQDMFPDLSVEDREVLIGNKKGWYLCPTCWDQSFEGEAD